MPETTTNAAPAERAAVLFLTAETPVHAGSGNVQAALDLPIQRSVQTGWPIINDSTLRGAWRGEAEDRARDANGEIPDPMKGKITAWFGSEDTATPKAGGIASPDAEILLFPVTSVRGITAWVTCREALEYFARKLELFRSLLSSAAQGKLTGLRTALDSTPAPGRLEALVTTGSEVAWEQQGKVVLEVDSYALGATRVDALAQWFADNACPHSDYWANRIKSHFVVLPEHAFTHYTKHKTDVRTRVKLEHSTVKHGPWTEENLPVDTVLYTVLAEPEGSGELLQDFLEHIKVTEKPALQLGGDQNLGRGFVRLRRLGD
jgi:CRISPR-associated protein Cmr4